MSLCYGEQTLKLQALSHMECIWEGHILSLSAISRINVSDTTFIPYSISVTNVHIIIKRFKSIFFYL